MKSIRQRVLKGEMVCGTWVVLGSSLAAEITGNAGWDWVLLDMEHGMGGSDSLLAQLQAVESTPAAPLVRCASNARFERSAQRSDNSIARSTSERAAGSSMHSSNCIWMSAPRRH